MKKSETKTKSTMGKAGLADKLSKLTKDELVALLIHFSKEMKEVEQELVLRFMSMDTKANMASYKKIIRSSIKDNADRYGFVAYRQVSGAVDGAEKVMRKAEEALAQGQYLHAADIVFCILHEMGDLLQCSDDSDGIVGGMIRECLDVIHHIAVNLDIEQDVKKDQTALFRLILREALHPLLDGWSEWQLSLMESAMLFLTSQTERELWEKQLIVLKDKNGNSSYFEEHAANLQYLVIQSYDGEQEAERYLEEHLSLTVFREMVIKHAIKNANFERALQLAQDGEEQDGKNGFPGLVAKWKEYRYEVYKATNQREQQLALTEEFVLSGKYAYYLELKELCSPDEWEPVYHRVLNSLANGGKGYWSTERLYTRILIEEKEVTRLLEYVQSRKREIVEYYPHLISQYADEVYQLFQEWITESAAEASSRNQYKKVCGTIKHLIKAGGTLKAKEVIEQLILAYPYRTALKDELRSIKLV